MDYELYHDKSLEWGFWHGMLLVPVPKKDEFCELLNREDQFRLPVQARNKESGSQGTHFRVCLCVDPDRSSVSALPDKGTGDAHLHGAPPGRKTEVREYQFVWNEVHLVS